MGVVLSLPSHLKGPTPWLTLAAILILALLLRLPYFETIPAADDEILQSMVARQIAEEGLRPLVPNDPYTGPFFVYLLAGLIQLGADDPLLLGRTPVLAAGLLTIALTYAWALKLTRRPEIAALAALFLTTNTHHILINSRLGGSTYLLPLFTTALLFFLTLLYYPEKPERLTGLVWAAAAGVMGGLALHSNPLGIFALFGGLVFGAGILIRAEKPERPHYAGALGLIGLTAALTYSPVLIYNWQNGLTSIESVGERSYLWQTEPDISTFLTNSGALARQLNRQLAGVVSGDQTRYRLFSSPLGIYLAASVAGLVRLTRDWSVLPLLMILPLLPVMGWFSSHYGLLTEGRFTTWILPITSLALALALWGFINSLSGRIRTLGIGLALFLVVFPLWETAQFLRHPPPRYDGSTTLILSRQMAAEFSGQPVYISQNVLPFPGVGYVPRTYLIFAGIEQSWLSPDELWGRLYAAAAAGLDSAFLLDQATFEQLRSAAPLEAWSDPINIQAQAQGFGVYAFDGDSRVNLPDFVVSRGEVEPQQPLNIVIGDGINLLGTDPPPAVVTTGDAVEITLYYQKAGELVAGDWIGFIHMVDSQTQTVVSQDDHPLGRSRYPFAAWQPDQVIVDRFSLLLPTDLPTGKYQLHSGIYRWPTLERLSVSEGQDDLIFLTEITVESQPQEGS